MARKKKLAAKYVVRRVLFVVLFLLLLLLLIGGIWLLLFRGEKGEKGSSASPMGSSASSSRTGTGGEGEIPPPGISSAQSGSGSPDSREETSGAAASGGGLISGEASGAAPAPDPEQENISGSDPLTHPEDWRLILINPHHAIEKELDIQLEEVNGYRFDSRIAGKVRELIAAAKEDGIYLAVISGYRTMERSRVLYANKIAEYKNMGYDDASARVEAARWVAPPGTSEHHSGLAMDIVSSDYYTKYSDLVEAFENDKEAIWLRENCARFGFILRFPKDKTEITGINYEPWHFRYVGEEHAKAIMEQGLCLEEYLGVTD